VVNNLWPLCIYGSGIQFALKNMLVMVLSDRSIILTFVDIVTLLIFWAVIVPPSTTTYALEVSLCPLVTSCKDTVQPLHPPFLLSSFLPLH
jgi:hypothetical protein